MLYLIQNRMTLMVVFTSLQTVS